jgi:hypothetical protein
MVKEARVALYILAPKKTLPFPVYKEKKIALGFSAKMVWKRKGEKKRHKNILRE